MEPPPHNPSDPQFPPLIPFLSHLDTDTSHPQTNVTLQKWVKSLDSLNTDIKNKTLLAIQSMDLVLLNRLKHYIPNIGSLPWPYLSNNLHLISHPRYHTSSKPNFLSHPHKSENSPIHIPLITPDYDPQKLQSPPSLQMISATSLCNSFWKKQGYNPSNPSLINKTKDITNTDFITFLKKNRLFTNNSLQICAKDPIHIVLLQKKKAKETFQKRLPPSKRLPDSYYSSIIILSEYTSICDSAINTSSLANTLNNNILKPYTKSLQNRKKINKSSINSQKTMLQTRELITTLSDTHKLLGNIDVPSLIYSLASLELKGKFSKPLIQLLNYLTRELIEYVTLTSKLIKIINKSTHFAMKSTLHHDLYPPITTTKTYNNIIKTCTSIHNIPYCHYCGWLTSWTKSLNQKGIVIICDNPLSPTTNNWTVPHTRTSPS